VKCVIFQIKHCCSIVSGAAKIDMIWLPNIEWEGMAFFDNFQLP